MSEIVIRYEEDPSFHIFSVGDDGVGIKGEGADMLFKPFHRDKTSQGTEGTGLGLAIVKEIAERHGGRAWLKQEVSRGATFCFSVAKEFENRESK